MNEIVIWLINIFILENCFLLVSADLQQLREHDGYEHLQPTCSCSDFEGPTMAMVCGSSCYSSFMDTLEHYLKYDCDLVDPTWCNDDSYEVEVDFIVVGSGASGSVVTSRLSENPNDSVLLLEAGGPAPTGTQIPGMYSIYNEYPEIDWNFDTEPLKGACLSNGGICRLSKGKVMGGSSVLQDMTYMRGHPKYFDEIKLRGWSWNDVMKYYLKSEDNQEIATHADSEHHARGGYLTVQRFSDQPEMIGDILEGTLTSFYENHSDLNGKHQSGFSIAQATTFNGSRLSASKAFLYRPEVFNRQNLKIQTNSYVTRVLIHESTKQVYGVEYIKNSKTFRVHARKEVILSAGTIQSPRILMSSGIGPRKHLKDMGIKVIQDLPGVGQNLRSHVSINLNYYVMKNFTSPINNSTIRQYFLERKGPLSSTGFSQLIGLIHSSFSNPQTDVPDLQVSFSGYLAGCSLTGSQDYIRDLNHIITITPTVLRPESVGHLELRNRFPGSQPKINTNFLNKPNDGVILLDGIRKVQEIIEISNLREVLGLEVPTIEACPYDLDSDFYWACAIRWATNPGNHQVGTCKMGEGGDSMAVTDELLRVRGIQHLRVVDASVLPNTLSGNLFAPGIMIGEKGADMIKATWMKKQCT